MTELADRPVDLSDLNLDPDDFSSNPSTAPCFQEVAASRMSRRTVLRGGMLAAAGFMTTSLFADTPAAYAAPKGKAVPPKGAGLLGFTAIAPSKMDEVVVPPGYTAVPFIPWGTPLQPNGPAFVPGSPDAGVTGGNTAADQEQQVGMHHDGMHYFPIGSGRNASLRGLLVVNHEYTDEGLLHTATPAEPAPGAYTLEMVRKSQAAHGVSVVEVREDQHGSWKVVPSKSNRRITANTPMTFSGPAADSPLLDTGAPANGSNPVGTINNCSHGYTPWGTYLACEENFNGYFGGVPTKKIGDEDVLDYTSFGDDAELLDRYGAGGNRYSWSPTDKRFALAPGDVEEVNRFGWVVEIDPFTASSTPVKRTALGRIKHEGAFVHVTKGGRVVVYMGDDQRNDYAYKFVSSGNWKSLRARGLSPLDEGTLYVARFNNDGSGTWLPLIHGEGGLTPEAGFADQAEVLVKTRLAADVLEATPMDRPEWTTVDQTTGMVYLTLTNNTSSSKEINAANPRKPNPWGHIIRWQETGNDHTATSFRWDLFLLAGQGRDSETNDGSTILAEDAFGSPDGLWADPDGRVWIQTDGSQPGKVNDQMLAADPRTLDSNGVPEVRRFLTGVRGAEVTGVITTPDQRTMFVNLQHPGDGGLNTWPQEKGVLVPRSSTVVIVKNDGGVIGT